MEKEREVYKRKEKERIVSDEGRKSEGKNGGGYRKKESETKRRRKNETRKR